MGTILKTIELTKRYKGQIAVNRISLGIEKNSVYGLLGPNRAGKSTILKMIAGIFEPTSGRIEFDGHEWSRNDLREIGALIENPPLYDNLTAYENLKVRTLALGLSDERISEVLTIVQLTNTGKKRAGQFSLGMKQRLGIALALLAQPKLLILDVKWSMVFIVYCVYSVQKKREKGTTTQILAIAFPFVISIVCQIVAEQELHAGHFQNMLTLSSCNKAIFSKLAILLIAGLFSVVLCTVLFGVSFSYMTETKLPVGFFVLIPIVLWVSNVMLYGLHLILAFRFGRYFGISSGVIGSLLSALLQTGLGDGRWYVIPYGL